MAIEGADEEVENWDENRTRVDQLCQTYPNNMCNDCNNAGTRWASVNHGVFLCIRCSGIHRSLGVHVSKVKSANMDKWSAAEVHLMELIGNQRAKLLYEAHLPKDMKPMTFAESDATLQTFIQRKYQEKAFSVEAVDEKLRQYHKEARYGKKPKRNSSASRKKKANDGANDKAERSLKGEDTIKALYGSNAEVISKMSKRTGPIRGTFGVVNVGPEAYDERRKTLLEQFGFS